MSGERNSSPDFLLRIAIVDVQHSIEWENPEQLSAIKNSSRKVHMEQ